MCIFLRGPRGGEGGRSGGVTPTGDIHKLDFGMELIGRVFFVFVGRGRGEGWDIIKGSYVCTRNSLAMMRLDKSYTYRP